MKRSVAIAVVLTLVTVVATVALVAREPAATDAPAAAAVSDRAAAAIDAWSQGDVVDVLWAAPIEAASTASTADERGTGYGLFHARSRDGGRSFGGATRIGAEWAALHAPHRGTDPQIAAAGDHLVAVWTSPGTSKWGTGPLAVAVSRDGGRTWSRGGNPADDNSTDGHGFIDVAADPDGGFHAVWLDGRDGDSGLRVASSADGLAWRPNANVDAVTCQCCWNDLAVLGPGRLAVLYRDRDPRDMAVAISEDGARSWERRGVAGDFGWKVDGCPHVGGGLAVLPRSSAKATSSSSRERSASGETIHALVWTGAPGRAGLYDVSSTDGGRRWSEPRELGGRGARHGDLATVNGELVAAWDEGAAIWAARSADGVTWSPPRRLTGHEARAAHPLVAATSDGALILWTESGVESNAATRWSSARF